MNFIEINEKRYNCLFINENTIKIDDYMLAKDDAKVHEFLSNKNIIIDECKEKYITYACNIKNSTITVKKLIIRYQSKYFKYYPEDKILKERTEMLDKIVGDNTRVIVESYYIYSGLEWSMDITDIDEYMDYLREHKNADKILLVHSDKLIGMVEGLEKYFNY